LQAKAFASKHKQLLAARKQLLKDQAIA